VFDTSQPGVHPRRVNAVLMAAKSGERDGQVGVAGIALFGTVEDEKIGVQARVQERRMQGVARVREPLRQPDLCQRLMPTEMNLPDAAKPWSIFEAESGQALIQGTHRNGLSAASLDLLRRKRRRALCLRLAQRAGDVR